MPRLAAPDATPDKPMATPIPTEEIGETIIAAKDIPIKTLITNGCSLVKVKTIRW